MKTVQIIALICALLMFSSTAMAQSGLITKFDNGFVDWSSHTIKATGIGKFDPDLTPSQYRLSGTRSARLDAENNLLKILVSLNYTCDKTIRELMVTSVEAANRIEEMVKEYRIINKPRLMPDSSIAIDIEFTLSGDLLEELVEISGQRDKIQDEPSTLGIESISLINPLHFDCRGLKVKPSIAPLIKNERGEIIFALWKINYTALKDGPPVDYISEAETEKQSGAIDIDGLETIPVIKVEKCNLVIDDIDFENLISSEVHLKALKNGQVVILVD